MCCGTPVRLVDNAGRSGVPSLRADAAFSRGDHDSRRQLRLVADARIPVPGANLANEMDFFVS
jgi:hypothetical protein